MDARNSIDPGILLLLPTAGGGTAICQYFSKARCVLAVHLFSIFLMSPGAEENRRGARGLSVLPISEQYEVRTPLTDNDRRLHAPTRKDRLAGSRKHSYGLCNDIACGSDSLQKQAVSSTASVFIFRSFRPQETSRMASGDVPTFRMLPIKAPHSPDHVCAQTRKLPPPRKLHLFSFRAFLARASPFLAAFRASSISLS